MHLIPLVLIGLIAIQHIYILVLEMFLWDKPAGMKVFKLKEQFAKDSKALAANQGLYNGFLVAGLIWSIFEPNADFAFKLQFFFLSCVLVAGIYGGLSAIRSIMWVQGGPALLALITLFIF